MPSRHALITLCALALATSCRGPEPLDPGPAASAAPDDPDATELRMGQSQMIPIVVPLAYTLLDINRNGDLLLGDTWLPRGAPHPVPLPFIGRAISDSQQVLGYGLFYFEHGTVTGFPTPCSPITREGYYWDCSGPVELITQGPNGDILATWRQDAPGTDWSPYHSAAVWRVGTSEWEPLLTIFGDGPYFTGVLSESGTVAIRLENAPNPDQGLVRTRQGTHSLTLAGACPPPSPDPMGLDIQSVNDPGEVVGIVQCNVGGEFESRGVRWSRIGSPSPVDGIPAAIDNFGNIAGIRTDGRAVIWLAGGRVIDLSRDVGQPISIRKFMRAGSLFAYFGTQPAVWRFGYRCHRWTGPLC